MASIEEIIEVKNPELKKQLMKDHVEEIKEKENVKQSHHLLAYIISFIGGIVLTLLSRK